MQWVSLRTARSICSKARFLSLASSSRPATLIRGKSPHIAPSQLFLPHRSIFNSHIHPFPEPDTKLKHSVSQHPDEAEYFDHLLDIHERFQRSDETLAPSGPYGPPLHKTPSPEHPDMTTPPRSPLPRQFKLRPPSSQLIKTSLPPNRCAIASAGAVRIACRDNAIRDAEYIVQSLIYSNIPDAPATVGLELPVLGRFEYIPILFERPVSPRLAAHSLIHHYLRCGNVLKAKASAERFMRDGVRIHGTTFQVLAAALIQSPPTTLDVLREGGKIMLHQMDVIGDGDLIVSPEMVRSDGARFALVLLLKARENGQRDGDRLLERFASVFLLNGEILLGAILFAMIVKDFESRWQRAQALKAKVAMEEASSGTVSSESRSNVAQAIARISRIPPMRIMKSIVRQCSDEISAEPLPEADGSQRGRAYQALAYLASLIDSRSLPYSDVSTLLRALYSCPRDGNNVWVLQDGQLGLVNAYTYFHKVLHRLAKHPPAKARGPPTEHSGTGDNPGPPLMPQFTRETYNTLVHYALRHRMSLSLARDLLQHMELVRSPGLKPDITTYNIFLRSGTLLRQNYLSSFALEELRMGKMNNRHGIMVLPYSPALLRPSAQQPIFRSEEVKGKLDRPPTPLSKFLRLEPPSQPLIADSVTLASYISHLTSTGRPDVVVDVLWYILPEISIIDHPAWDNVTPEQRAAMAQMSRQKRLDRAASLGPYFFTTVLNALCKSGRTGLAERVWLLAKQAEMASWLEASGDGQGRVVQGWRLPVHAYTIMLQVYAKEARKGIGSHPGRRWETNWNPTSAQKIRHGWAQYVAYRTRVTDQRLSRRLRALRMATVHYRSMWRGARAIYWTLTRFDPECAPDIPAVQPDARFFNAALDLFGRQIAMVRRSRRPSRSHWRRLNLRTMLRYSRTGTVSRNWNPFLKRIVHEMLDAGMTVPIGFRRFFVDTWLYTSLDRPERPLRHRQPYRFPKYKTLPFRPHALSTAKIRGLPISRETWIKKLGRDGKEWWRRRRGGRNPEKKKKVIPR